MVSPQLRGEDVTRRAVLRGAGAVAAAVLAGCSQGRGGRDDGAASLADVTLTVWRYKSTAGQFIEAAGQADTPYTVRYADLPGGPPVLNAYAANVLDYAHMSLIPPIYALQAKVPIRLIAVHHGDVNNTGILLRKGSSAQRVEDLRGRTVTYTPSTNEHYYLLKLLEAHGMTLADVQPVGLPTNDANGAFSRGHVEARVTGGITALFAEAKLDARWLVRSIEGLYSGNFCVSAHPAALADPLKRAAIKDYLERERATWVWVDRNPEAWARICEEQTALPAGLFLRLAREKSRLTRIVPPDREAIADQQTVADDLARYGLVKNGLDVSTLWETVPV